MKKLHTKLENPKTLLYYKQQIHFNLCSKLKLITNKLKIKKKHTIMNLDVNRKPLLLNKKLA